MAMIHAGESTILEIGIAYLDEVFPTLGPEIKMTLIHAMSTYLGHQITFDQAQKTFLTMIGRTDPLDRLREIVEQPDEPLNLNSGQSSADADDGDESSANRKKTRSWTAQEDTRLLAGIYRFGADNWTTISLYIGNGRTRAQCCQRWTRGLNPRISKNLWSYEEDLKLVQLVNTYGDKSWTKIASMMGNRSDVQCRYHYHQVMRDMPPLFKKMVDSQQGNIGQNPLAAAMSRQVGGEMRSSINAQLPARYSLPQLTSPRNDITQALSQPDNNVQNNNNNNNNHNQTQLLSNMRPVLSQPMFPEAQNPTFDQSAQPQQFSQLIQQQINLQSQMALPQQNNAFQVQNVQQMKQMQMTNMQPMKVGQMSQPIPPLNSMEMDYNYQTLSSSKSHHQRRSSMAPVPRLEKTKFPSPPNLEKRYSGTDGIDSFLKNFKC